MSLVFLAQHTTLDRKILLSTYPLSEQLIEVPIIECNDRCRVYHLPICLLCIVTLFHTRVCIGVSARDSNVHRAPI